MKTIFTGSMPHGLAITGNELYIAEYGDNTVSFADLTSSSSLSQSQVGFGPHRIMAVDNQIYVSNYGDGSLSVLEPGRMGVAQEIYGLGRPLEMDFNEFYHRLYIANAEKGTLAVIDTSSNRLLGEIVLGAQPFALDVIQ